MPHMLRCLAEPRAGSEAERLIDGDRTHHVGCGVENDLAAIAFADLGESHIHQRTANSLAAKLRVNKELVNFCCVVVERAECNASSGGAFPSRDQKSCVSRAELRCQNVRAGFRDGRSPQRPRPICRTAAQPRYPSPQVREPIGPRSRSLRRYALAKLKSSLLSRVRLPVSHASSARVGDLRRYCEAVFVTCVLTCVVSLAPHRAEEAAA